MEKELLRQLEELEKRAKKMTGRSTGQTYVMWKSIETKAKELQSLLKAVQESGWDGWKQNLPFFIYAKIANTVTLKTETIVSNIIFSSLIF